MKQAAAAAARWRQLKGYCCSTPAAPDGLQVLHLLQLLQHGNTKPSAWWHKAHRVVAQGPLRGGTKPTEWRDKKRNSRQETQRVERPMGEWPT